MKMDWDKMTPQERGAALERLFAEHMQKNLGFAKADRNQLRNGKTATQAWEADIIGVKHQPIWRVVYAFALLVMLAGILTLLWPKAVPQVSNVMSAAGTRVQKVARIKPAGAGVILIGGAAFVLGLLGDRRSRKYVWVESKNRKVRVKRDDVNKTLAAVADVRRLVGRKRTGAIDEVWFVSAVGYDVDAVNFARANGVIMFLATITPKRTTFERLN